MKKITLTRTRRHISAAPHSSRFFMWQFHVAEPLNVALFHACLFVCTCMCAMCSINVIYGAAWNQTKWVTRLRRVTERIHLRLPGNLNLRLSIFFSQMTNKWKEPLGFNQRVNVTHFSPLHCTGRFSPMWTVDLKGFIFFFSFSFFHSTLFQTNKIEMIKIAVRKVHEGKFHIWGMGHHLWENSTNSFPNTHLTYSLVITQSSVSPIEC